MVRQSWISVRKLPVFYVVVCGLSDASILRCQAVAKKASK